MKDIFIITGQTATGKTEYALELALKTDGELINCDSRQIYKHLDIVTGKDINTSTFHLHEKRDSLDIGFYTVPVKNRETKLWLYDIVDPDVVFSSYQYEKLCIIVIKDILSRGKTPILVGGTYFYLSQLLYSKGEYDQTIDWDKRNDLEKKSIEELQVLLKNKDSQLFESMNNSDRNNPRRLIRRLEILGADSIEDFHHNKHDKTILLNEKIKDRDIRVHFEGLYRQDRETMKKAIQHRVRKRISNGAITEAEKVFRKFPQSSPGLKSIGYSQIRDYLEKKIDRKQLIESWINKEYQYAKRQYIFMKRDSNIFWTNIP